MTTKELQESVLSKIKTFIREELIFTYSLVNYHAPKGVWLERATN